MGSQKTAPFTLAPGNYTIAWSGTDPGGRFGGGILSIGLRPVDSRDYNSESIASVILKSGETQTGATNAYNLKGGQYYLDVSAPGAWRVVFIPQ